MFELLLIGIVIWFTIWVCSKIYRWSQKSENKEEREMKTGLFALATAFMSGAAIVKIILILIVASLGITFGVGLLFN
ncbi:MAG: hypothetical protein OXI87_19805 [Albidovulum sp.]|nr:hypothetical protein [Albidovulum sp.]